MEIYLYIEKIYRFIWSENKIWL